jgi:hypothetical protein
MRLLQQPSYVGLYGAILIGAMVSTHLVTREPGEYLHQLADAFAAGQLHVETFSPDLSAFNGRYYYPDGPLRCRSARRLHPLVTGLEPHYNDLLAIRQGCEVESIGLLEATSSKNFQT